MLRQHCQDRRDRRYQHRNPNSIINNGNEPYPRRQTLIGSVLAPIREQKQKILQPALSTQQPQPQQPYQQPPQQPHQQQPYQYQQQPYPPQAYRQQPYQHYLQQSNQNPTWRDQPSPRSQDRDLPKSQEEGEGEVAVEENGHQDDNNNSSYYYYYYDNITRQDTQNAQRSTADPPMYQTMNNTRIDKPDSRLDSLLLLSRRKREQQSERDRKRDR